MKIPLLFSLALLAAFPLPARAQEPPLAPPLIRIVADAYRFPPADAAALLGPKTPPGNAETLLAKVKMLVAKGAGTLSGQLATTAENGRRSSAKSGDYSLDTEVVRSPAGDAVDANLRFQAGERVLTTSVLIRENEPILLGTLAARDTVDLVFARYESIPLPPPKSQQGPGLPEP